MKIVIICIDALRADYVGTRMQEFLDSGLEFTNAYAGAPGTLPSVPTFLTGVTAGQHGLVDLTYKSVVPTIMDRLREKGFRAVAYSANTFIEQLKDSFDEWIPLNWLSKHTQIGEPEEIDLIRPGQPWSGWERLKETQDNYDQVWEDIEHRTGDLIAYVHLMDVHGPYRQIPEVPLDSLPQDYRSHRLGIWIFNNSLLGKDVLSDEEWERVRMLYRAEAEYVDSRLEFPGDLTILLADHGEMIRESPGDGACLGHISKYFLECLLRVPFGLVGYQQRVKIDDLFNLRLLPALIEAILDDQELPSGADLYWEDFMYGSSFFAIKNPARPRETLVMGDDCNYVWYQTSGGKRFVSLDDVPDHMIRKLLARMVKAGSRHHLFLKDKDAWEDVVMRRLQGLGYA